MAHRGLYSTFTQLASCQAMPGEVRVAVATAHNSYQPHPSAAFPFPEGYHEDCDQWYAHDEYDDEHSSDDSDQGENNVGEGPAPTNPPGSPAPILLHFTPQFECCEETALSRYSSR